MARTKQTAKRHEKALITWTRFHLPREQEWPMWSVGYDDFHVGPLEGVQGWRKALLGRMVDNPEQAAYIIGKSHLNRERVTYLLTNLVVKLCRMGHSG